VQRWPETKRLLGLLVNSSGRAHGRNARRLVHAARKQDRRLAVGLLAAAVSHTPEGEEVLRGARMRMARKPSAVARELLRNFPKGGKRRRKRKRGGNGENGNGRDNGRAPEAVETDEIATNGGAPEERPKRRGRRRKAKEAEVEAEVKTEPTPEVEEAPEKPAEKAKPKKAKAKAAKPKSAKPAKDRKPAKAKASKEKAAKPKAAAKRKRKPKSAEADSEAGQMNIPGAEGDPVAVGESDE
jgi:ribonuclease E